MSPTCYHLGMLRRRCERAGLLTLVLALLGGCPVCPDPLYEITAETPAVRLPLDESVHCFGGAEWWYYTGRLVAGDGRSFGVETVIFHAPRFPYAVITEVWFAHFAILDERTGEFTYDQCVRLDPSPDATQPGPGFQLSTRLVSFEGRDGRDRITAEMSDGRYSLALSLQDTREPILHGGDGYVPYGATGSSFYYSRPRMNAAGTLAVGGEVLDVSGRFWFDRQWGLDLRNPLQPWDWFSIRLDDGTDIMLFRFPGRDEPVALGTLVPATGEPQHLGAVDFSITPTATWTSPATGIEYDVGWEVAIPAADLLLSVTAVAENQEFDARSSTLNAYWEGLCDVEGLEGGSEISGHAFIEQANGGA